MTFSEKLKKLRKENKLDQNKLVDKEHLNISISTLRRYEQTGQYPNIETLMKMKKIFNVSYDYLLDDNCTTTMANNMEIANDLGITEKTVDSIRKIKNKDFLEDFFANEECTELLAILKEKADLNLSLECGIDFCNKLYKSKKYNEPTAKMINTMQMLVDYMKQEKLKKDYWEFFIDRETEKGFISSISYILNCWKKEKQINECDAKLKFFNNEIFEKIKDKLNEYDRTCLSGFEGLVNKFNGIYINNKKKKLKI